MLFLKKTQSNLSSFFSEFLKSKKRYQLYIFLLFCIGFVVRFFVIKEQYTTAIESFTVVHVIEQPSLVEMIRADSSIPPLQYLVVRFISWFSTNIFWLRVPNLFLYSVVFCIIYALSRRISKMTALLSVLLYVFSLYQIEHAWESYVYLFFQYWGAVSLYSLCKLLFDRTSKWETVLWSILFFVSNVAGWFSHYSFIWYIVTIFSLSSIRLGYSLFTRTVKKREVLVTFLSVLSFVPILAYLPLFLSIYGDALRRILWFKQLTVVDIGKSFFSSVGLYSLWKASPFDLFVGKIFSTASFLLFILYSVRLLIIKKLTMVERFFIHLNLGLLFFYILVPYVFSVVLGQSILVRRTLVVLSLSMTFALAIILKKSFTRRWVNKTFVVTFFVLFFVHSYEVLKVSKIQTFEEQSVAYELVQFAKKQDIKAIMFLDTTAVSPPFIKTDFIHYLFDYYWYGYDGSQPQPPYQLISYSNVEDFVGKKEFWIVVIRHSENNKKVIEDHCKLLSNENIIANKGYIAQCLRYE